MSANVVLHYKASVRYCVEAEEQFVDMPTNAHKFLGSTNDDVDSNGHVLERLQEDALLPQAALGGPRAGEVLNLLWDACTGECAGHTHAPGSWPRVQAVGQGG